MTVGWCPTPAPPLAYSRSRYGGGPALPRSLVPVRDSESKRLVCEPQLYPVRMSLPPATLPPRLVKFSPIRCAVCVSREWCGVEFPKAAERSGFRCCCVRSTTPLTEAFCLQPFCIITTPPLPPPSRARAPSHLLLSFGWPSTRTTDVWTVKHASMQILASLLTG